MSMCFEIKTKGGFARLRVEESQNMKRLFFSFQSFFFLLCCCFRLFISSIFLFLNGSSVERGFS